MKAATSKRRTRTTRPPRTAARRAKRPAHSPAPVTPLSARLKAPARATPRDLFALALQKWNAGERFDIGKMAEELGVSRATVFRWVGSRELLYGEVISTLFESALRQAMADADGEGPEKFANITRALMTELIGHAPLKTFVQQDPEYAMRILMSKSSTVEARSAQSVRGALEEHAARKEIRPVMKLGDLSYLIVRIGQTFLYRDALTSAPVDLESAISAIRILVAAEK